MNFRLLGTNVDRKARCRLSSATIISFIAFCILIIYISNVVTMSSLSTNKKYWMETSGIFNNGTNNKSIETQNESQNGNSKKVEGKVMQTQRRSDILAKRLAKRAKIVNYTIRSIIDVMRGEIAIDMEDFEYTDEMTGLSELTPETNGNPLRSVILSTWRSGSTFFGDILSAMPGSFYHFEPLMYLGDIIIRTEINLVTEATTTLHQLLKCNYTGQDKYQSRVMLHYNTRLWRFCKAFPAYKLCHNQSFLSAFCSLFPFQVMKLVRLRAAFAEPLLMDSSLNVKIVLLIRDPRGVMSSRNREKWCLIGPECGNYTNLCRDMVSDYKAAQYLTKKYPQRFKVLRYEDLSLDPFKETEDVLNFYGLPFHDYVKEFLESHTSSDAGNSMSTFRETRRTLFSWRHKSNFTVIDQVQSQCTEAMELWGYEKVNSEDELMSNTFFPLLRSPFDTGNYTF